MKIGGGGKMGSKFFLKQMFLGRNFGEQVRRKNSFAAVLGAKILGGIFASNISFWEEHLEAKCFGEERNGEQKFWEANFDL